MQRHSAYLLQQGGHKVLLRRDWRVRMKFVDVMILAEDMGTASMPADHEDCDNFLPRQIPRHHLFGLVFCDGQVLRTHNRPEYREQREARRLLLPQIAIGIEHIKSGGTMIVLLHKLDRWEIALVHF
ncbi:hypothetical protein CPLU01_15584 [Colletotrichum plurivorum]|uniref:Uncharacterized protein n=1 Tax=Colletotrichum plurivorum TaxID=2175906 RepID=A0A8H6JAG8_9PEZI|nr:hypothetical protein CPLU01_15584 [Colletotrichum plurivorum]